MIDNEDDAMVENVVKIETNRYVYRRIFDESILSIPSPFSHDTLTNIMI